MNDTKRAAKEAVEMLRCRMAFDGGETRGIIAALVPAGAKLKIATQSAQALIQSVSDL